MHEFARRLGLTLYEDPSGLNEKHERIELTQTDGVSPAQIGIDRLEAPQFLLPHYQPSRSVVRPTEKRKNALPGLYCTQEGGRLSFWCNKGLCQRPGVTIALVQPTVLSIGHWARGVKDEV